MFCLCFTEHTKAHALCLWPYMQKNHICFKHTLQLNCHKPIGMKMKINQVSLKVLWGKITDCGVLMVASIHLIECLWDYLLCASGVHVDPCCPLTQLQWSLSLCPLKNREITSIHAHTHTWAIVFRFCQSTLNVHGTAGFFRKHAWQSTSKQSLSVLMTVFQNPVTFSFFLFRVILLFTVLFASLFCLLFLLFNVKFFFFFYGPTKNHMRWQSVIQYFLLSSICFPFTKDYKKEKKCIWGFLFC